MKTKSDLVGNHENSAEMAESSLILDVNGEPIDPLWAAEFRGFFWGEGTFRISMAAPLAKRRPDLHWTGFSYNIQASIGLRSDDGDVLREFQRRLGGNLKIEMYRDGSGKSVLRWVAGKVVECERIGRVLSGSTTGLPFSKQRQLSLWMEAIRIKVRNLDKSGSACKSRKSYSQEDSDYFRYLVGEIQAAREWTG